MIEVGTLFYCHISKCGGLSFRQLLENKYGKENCFDIYEFFCDHERYLSCANPVVYGHAAYCLKDLMKQPVDVITILRDPIDRVVSYYKHVSREKQDVLIKHCYDYENAEQICNDPVFVNSQSNEITRTLSIKINFDGLLKKCREINNREERIEFWSNAYRDLVWNSRELQATLTPENLKLAKQSLVDMRFGFQENYKETVLPLIGARKSVRINTAPKLQSSILDSDEARNLLKPLNSLDIELYDFAKVLYAQRESYDFAKALYAKRESEDKNMLFKNKFKRLFRKIVSPNEPANHEKPNFQNKLFSKTEFPISKMDISRVSNDRPPSGNFQHGYVYAGDKTVISETHFGCQMFLNLRNFDVVPSILKTGWWEPWNDKLVRSILREKDTYINCGANFGYFSLLGAWCVGSEGKAVSIEANPWIFEHLMKSILYSGMLDRTKALNCAVGPVTGKELSVLFAPEWAGGGYVQFKDSKKMVKTPLSDKSIKSFTWPNVLGNQHIHGPTREYRTGKYSKLLSAQIPTNTLDDICSKDIAEARLIHMDIEGAEPGTILGAKKLISGSRDLFMIFEWSSLRHKSKAGKEQAQKAIDFLIDQKFKFYKIFPNGDAYLDFPDLIAIDKDALMVAEHCDIFCTRQ